MVDAAAGLVLDDVKEERVDGGAVSALGLAVADRVLGGRGWDRVGPRGFAAGHRVATYRCGGIRNLSPIRLTSITRAVKF